MPRPRPPHLHKETTRHGRTVWYVRVGRGPRIRLRAEFGTPEFAAEYQAAITGEAKPKTGAPKTGSLRWLVDRYRESAHWRELRGSTRAIRERVFRQMLETSGSAAFRSIRRQDIQHGVDRRESRFAAATFLKTVRGLFRWAVSAGHIEEDPTIGVRRPSQRTTGHKPWTDEDFTAYEARWPIGTRERLALDLLAYTGVRRGDLVRLGRQHLSRETHVVRGERVELTMLRFRTEKTGTPVAIPLLASLVRSIEATECGDLVFLQTKRGGPFIKESFGTWFAKACKAAGVPARAHGIRKAAATRAAYHGATEAELDAMFGWSGGRTAFHYIRDANRDRLAIAGTFGLSGEQTGDAYSRTQEKSAGGDAKK